MGIFQKMKGKIMKKGYEVYILGVISFLISFIGVFCVPESYQASVGQAQGGAEDLRMIPAVCMAGIFAATAYLRFYCGKKAGKSEKFRKALWHVAVMFLCFLVGVLLVSLLSGLLSVGIYKAAKDTLSLSQIKGIIDFTAAILTLLPMPLFVYAFWRVMTSKDRFSQIVKHTFQFGWERYGKLFFMLVLVYGVGILLSAVFHYAPQYPAMRMIKFVVFGVLGTIAFIESRKLCEKKSGPGSIPEPDLYK